METASRLTLSLAGSSTNTIGAAVGSVGRTSGGSAERFDRERKRDRSFKENIPLIPY